MKPGDDDYPVIDAVLYLQAGSPVARFKDPCPGCGKRHLHGYGNGHRVSHCPNKDAFPHGYILRIVAPIGLAGEVGEE